MREEAALRGRLASQSAAAAIIAGEMRAVAAAVAAAAAVVQFWQTKSSTPRSCFDVFFSGCRWPPDCHGEQLRLSLDELFFGRHHSSAQDRRMVNMID